MPLVTDAEVKALIATTRDTTPFIASADLIVSENLAGLGLSDDRLKQIELYLAAHFVAVTEERGGLKSKKIGEASEGYAISGRGFSLTRFGQQAIDFDTSGTLKGISSAAYTARFMVV